MKTISTLLIALIMILLGQNSYAQSYEQKEEDHTHTFMLPTSNIYNLKNWEKISILTNKTINLFKTLDNGTIIIHEYFMIDCRPCITAGKGLEKLVKELRIKYPGRILYFQTVYENESNAKQALKWVKENNFTPDEVFIKGAEEVAFYGGMGMPTIVVLGGGFRHKGYYKKQGYSPRENGLIYEAVNKAIKTSPRKAD